MAGSTDAVTVKRREREVRSVWMFRLSAVTMLLTLGSTLPAAANCFPTDFLQRHVNDWNRLFNHDAQGKPLVPAYDEAVKLILQGKSEAALPFLDRAAKVKAEANAVPVEAASTAAGIRDCDTRSLRPQPQPLPPGWRRAEDVRAYFYR